MAQVFPRETNVVARLTIAGSVLSAGLLMLTALIYSAQLLWHGRGRGAGAAGAVQPRAPCRGSGDRLPILPHIG